MYDFREVEKGAETKRSLDPQIEINKPLGVMKTLSKNGKVLLFSEDIYLSDLENYKNIKEVLSYQEGFLDTTISDIDNKYNFNFSKKLIDVDPYRTSTGTMIFRARYNQNQSLSTLNLGDELTNEQKIDFVSAFTASINSLYQNKLSMRENLEFDISGPIIMPKHIINLILEQKTKEDLLNVMDHILASYVDFEKNAVFPSVGMNKLFDNCTKIDNAIKNGDRPSQLLNNTKKNRKFDFVDTTVYLGIPFEIYSKIDKMKEIFSWLIPEKYYKDIKVHLVVGDGEIASYDDSIKTVNLPENTTIAQGIHELGHALINVDTNSKICINTCDLLYEKTKDSEPQTMLSRATGQYYIYRNLESSLKNIVPEFDYASRTYGHQECYTTRIELLSVLLGNTLVRNVDYSNGKIIDLKTNQESSYEEIIKRDFDEICEKDKVFGAYLLKLINGEF